MLDLVFSNAVLCSVAAILLFRNRNWHLRSLLILVLCSNVGSILRHTLFAERESIQPFLYRINIWLNIGIGYFTFLMVHDAYQDAFPILRRQRIRFIRSLTIVYGLILLFFLTQDSFTLSMISYGLPVIVMFVLAFFTRPPRWTLLFGSTIIIGSSLYLSLAQGSNAGMIKPSDIYHYGLAVGMVIFYRAFNAEYNT